jgi:hypothetical protein
MFQEKHCDDFIKVPYTLPGSIEKKNLTVRKQSEKTALKGLEQHWNG